MGQPAFEGSVQRHSFSKIRSHIEIPDLVEVQRRSYEEFLQAETLPDRREDKGLHAAFKSVFPIMDYNNSAILEFSSYSLGTPKYDTRECIEQGMTFAAPLKLRVRLVVFDQQDKSVKNRVLDVREQEVYVGELPLMTERGTFMVNGTERVAVSQLHRSPGPSFGHDKGRTHSSGKVLFSGRIIPYRGSWLDFEYDAKDILYVRIDRRRKMPATILLKGFGFSTDDLLKMYYPVEEVRVVNGGLLRKLDPDIHAGLRSPADLFEKGSNEPLVKEGTKLNKTLMGRIRAAGIKEIPIKQEDLIGRAVLTELLDPGTQEVILEKNQRLTPPVMERILESGVEGFKIIYLDSPTTSPVILDTLEAERTNSKEEAWVEIYKRLRPGEMPSIESAKLLFENLFLNPKRYDLSPVGRLKMNKRFNLDLSLEQRTLSAQDIVEVVRCLVDLKAGKGAVDDIDHLGNRRVRSVGELLENQIRIGLARMERSIKERMNLLDMETVLPHDLINAKPIVGAIKEFFAGSQLSQFMDQTNPLAEITHKRRLSALGPGGLTRERAGFEVRDVHPSHYSRICPIETPEGPNIGLITSLATYARINEFGFIEAPFRKVRKGRVTDDVEFLSPLDGDQVVIAQANSAMNKEGMLTSETITAREAGEFVTTTPDKVDYLDVSPKQVVSVATALIPFLEHDDANRALMGSNMQRQAVPTIKSESPLVGTGMEAVVARDSGYLAIAQRDGIVESVDARRIVVRTGLKEKDDKKKGSRILDTYDLIKFQRTNQNTCITQTPIVRIGQPVKQGQVLADGPAMDRGELALGKNVLVAFMPWGGYNYEDAILLSEKMVKEDVFTSIHIEEFEVEARDTKLGKEEITRDIPNLGEEALRNLDESGIVRIGAEVKPGDILVGKVTPKGETQLTPEEKLLRAIFGEKAGDVKDTSLQVPPGIEGIVVDVKIFSRKGVDKDERSRTIETDDRVKVERDYQEELRIIEEERNRKIRKLLLGQFVGRDLMDPDSGEVILKKKGRITAEVLRKLSDDDARRVILADAEEQKKLDEIEREAKDQIEILQTQYDEKVGRLRRGDELPPGVIKLVKVYLAIKRKIAVGDKMAGRHGNKGVVSRIMAEEDMPYLPDGTPVQIVLNPLGVPSRMNVGQILETHLGWAAKALGIQVETPVFDGASEKEIKELLKKANLPESGQSVVYDGRTGEPFKSPVTVGYMYMLKLHHLVDDKIHARSIGPYSLVTQQPLGGKAQFGGQRLGEMEVWALQAYGAASTLQEFLTVKSDDVPGRSRMYEAIVKGENFLEPGLPESFNVLVKELQSLGLDVELIKSAD
ncbi:DNA-directed RNA polymerase subunit beta [Candidatus Nitrospira allomarina]|uniref:DNA-directed RNA polymerase subunit beta n=1 Tax=Candidatus Nitrospira allomarina TaxID=3020900 RepID=A0AA96JTU5_9BACT|nr:DNA-directed RNA polymerase subunit beta [Candidatus Nitrospira allomarina]WNM59490.1 DNA-directed RNA polymerase subunit beta [Candidatus Nitrospira allomarina]